MNFIENKNFSRRDSDGSPLSFQAHLKFIHNEMDLDKHIQFVSHFKGEEMSGGSLMDEPFQSPSIEKKNCNELKLISKTNTYVGHENINTPLIKKVVKKLRNTTFYKKIDQLKDYHLTIIQDNAHFNEVLQVSSMFLSKKIEVWSPYSNFVMVSKIIVFLQLLTFFIYAPIQIAFADYLNDDFQFCFNQLAFFVMIIDSFLKMNIAFFSKGVLIKNRTKILAHYLKNYFFFDLIILLTLGLFPVFALKSKLSRLINLLIYFQGNYFFLLYSDIIHRFKLDVLLKGKQQIIEILCVFLFLANLIGCLWYFSGIISQEYLPESENWIVINGLHEFSWMIHYIYSIYWAVVVIATVGFGDIHPTNVIEMSFSMFAIVMGCALYAYNLNKIGIILQKIYKEENEFKDDINIINNFMERKKIDSGLQTRIQEYLKFIWYEKKQYHTKKELEIMNTLSSTLREELLLESYGGILKAFPLLHEKFTEKSLKEMVSYIREIRFIPGDYIFHVRNF